MGHRAAISVAPHSAPHLAPHSALRDRGAKPESRPVSADLKVFWVAGRVADWVTDEGGATPRFALAPDPTPEGAGLRAMVAGSGGINSMSIGLTIRESVVSYDEDGLPIHDVSRAEIDHVSIVEAGAFSGAVWAQNSANIGVDPALVHVSRDAMGLGELP